MKRYERQMILPEIGPEGQARIAASHVLIIGAGGLGVPALLYLAGAGVGRITLVDPDRVAEGNLHRQPLYRMTDLGRFKALAAEAALAALNPAVRVTPVMERFDPSNADRLLRDCTLALDCADNFAVSYTLSDACQDKALPLISASALGLQGYAGGFCGGAPSLRAVFPDLPERAATCSTAGIMGPVVGMLGTLQAQMALSVILGLDPSPLGQMITFDATNWRIGGFRFDRAGEPGEKPLRFVAAGDIRDGDFTIDLRSREEAPHPAAPHALRLSPNDIATASLPAHDRRIIVCCRTGLRAWHAARRLQSRWPGEILLAALGDRHNGTAG